MMLLIIIFTLMSLGDSLRPQCVKTDECHCFTSTRSLEMSCPPNIYTGGEGVVIHIEEIEMTEWELRIDCLGDMDNYMDILPAMSAPDISHLKIQFCPLPKQGFQSLLDRFNINNLRYLSYKSYDLSNVNVTEDYFTGLETVTTLIFEGNNVKNIDTNVFEKMPNLEYLNIGGNNIPLVAELFTHLHNLKRLCFTLNAIQYIPDNIFENLKRLQLLELWSNNISALNNKSFSGLDNLRALELSFNHISSIQENTFHALANLENISLSFNKIEFPPRELFSKNKQLRLIKFMFNPVKRFSEYQFSDLPELTWINLSNVSLEAIPENIFWLSTKLQDIDMSQNHLQEIPKYLFKDTSLLKTLNLHKNSLLNISDEAFEKLSELRILHLDHNFLNEIKESLFSTLRNIVEIDLSYNTIQKINPKWFYNNEKLEILSLSHNDIEQIAGTPFAYLTELRVLDLSHNTLKDLNVQEFVMTKKNLSMLDVSFNQISMISVSDFIPVLSTTKLRINLSYNKIQGFFFSPSISGQLPDASEIDTVPPTEIILSHNPINCDCDALDLHRYLKGKLDPRLNKVVLISPDDLVCAEPKDLENILVDKVPVDKFYCPCLETLEDCNCLWRAFDNALFAECANRGLTNYPNMSLSRYYDRIEIDLSNNSLTSLFNRTDYENVTKLILSNNSLENLTWVPPHLEVLQLDNNRLQKLDPYILQRFDDTNLTNLTLNGNPWTCDCSTENFIKFLRHNPSKVNGISSIKCKNNVTLVDLSKESLCETRTLAPLISMIVVFLILMSLVAVSVYFRREIRLWLFSRNLCLCFITEEELDKDKTYDAFISYSHKNESVVQNLVEVLENCPHPYKLCIHYRDWVPGKSIAEQIISSVNDSKRTIIILSENFVESVWGKMEFQAAYLQAMKERRGKVIVILYNDVNIESLDEELKLYLKTNTYVKWGDPWFWSKLMYALPHENRRHAQKHANMMMSIEKRFDTR